MFLDDSCEVQRASDGLVGSWTTDSEGAPEATAELFAMEGADEGAVASVVVVHAEKTGTSETTYKIRLWQFSAHESAPTTTLVDTLVVSDQKCDVVEERRIGPRSFKLHRPRILSDKSVVVSYSWLPMSCVTKARSGTDLPAPNVRWRRHKIGPSGEPIVDHETSVWSVQDVVTTNKLEFATSDGCPIMLEPEGLGVTSMECPSPPWEYDLHRGVVFREKLLSDSTVVWHEGQRVFSPSSPIICVNDVDHCVSLPGRTSTANGWRWAEDLEGRLVVASLIESQPVKTTDKFGWLVSDALATVTLSQQHQVLSHSLIRLPVSLPLARVKGDWLGLAGMGIGNHGERLVVLGLGNYWMWSNAVPAWVLRLRPDGSLAGANATALPSFPQLVLRLGDSGWLFCGTDGYYSVDNFGNFDVSDRAVCGRLDWNACDHGDSGLGLAGCSGACGCRGDVSASCEARTDSGAFDQPCIELWSGWNSP
ncbi:MAG: hypothetical protein H6747_15500 [Deltaproteobacteria bacterium]|nr:hypothetical protein [Deltaproteobacteria bacterium]